MENVTVTDNQDTSVTEVNPQEASQEVSHETVEAQETQEQYIPFKNGKEKFVIQGQEVEADWETVKREYQLATVSRKKMEEAASIRKKADEALQHLYRAASEDPIALIRLLNPKFQLPQMGTAENSVNPEQEAASQNGKRPVDPKIQELESKLSKYDEYFQRMETQETLKVINQEMDEAVDKFPVLKGKYERELLKLEYRKALDQGLDLSIEDVAFYLARDIEQERNQVKQAEIQKQQENKRKAPVSARPAAASEKKGFESIDDVKRLIGRMT